MTHEIKLSEQYVQAVKDGEKTFEIRYNDRGYQKGDRIRFKVMENVPYASMDVSRRYRLPEYEITYVHGGLGMADNYVALAIKPTEGEGGGVN